MITNLEELLLELNKEPDEVKENEDGSKYVPISTVQATLDKLFAYNSWNFERENFGKTQAIGKGLLTVPFPPNGVEVYKSGTAGIGLNNEMKLDYPRLETMALLNAAKKLGRRFGRELNRNADDAPLPVTQLREKNNEDEEIDKELKAVTALVQRAETKEEALDIMKRTGFGFNMQMKEIAQSKPSKQTA